MFLKRLHLSNIRCFRKAEIDFDRPGGKNRKSTILVGENGNGKTTILQSIALAMAGKDAMPSLLTDVDAWVRNGADQGEIKVEIETANGEQRDLALVLRRGESPADVIARSETTAEPLNDALAHATRTYLTLAYGTSRRRSVDAARSQEVAALYPHPRARSLASLFNREIPLNPLERWVISLGTDDQKSIAGVVTDLVDEFLPKIAFHSIEESGAILFDTRDGLVPLHRLGNSVQSVTAFVGDLLFQITNIFSSYRDPLKARGLLLIDSVGVDLHPKLQRRLMDFLDTRLDNLQLVVTTQSIVLAQQARRNALHYCLRGEDGVEIFPFDGEPQKLRLNQLMMTEAFGDTTYESLEVETMKERYRELDDRGEDALTLSEKRELGRIRREIGTVPRHDSAAMSAEQVELLSQVKSLLKKGEDQ